MVVGAGMFLLVAPDGFVAAIAQPFTTTAGLYVAAVIRVAFGTILWRASGISRAPTAFRIIGILVIIAGVTTPLVGAERAREMVSWLVGQGPALLRAIGAVLLLVGGLIIYAFPTTRPPAA
jgi:uncharacterized protein YjeT (DUF2065 family)